MKVAIIGLGYVGLPLCLTCVESGLSVLGIDHDQTKVDSLLAGRSYISHIPSDSIHSALKNTFDVTADVSRVKECNVILICVPTPLDSDNKPDLSFVLNTTQSIAPHLSADTLVVLESTTYPGTTEEELLPILEKNSSLTIGQNLFLAYSPEREDPGNATNSFQNIPKLVGGVTPLCLEKAQNFYSKITHSVIPVSSCKVAEGAKLLENVFRSVNIALVNELKTVYEKMDIDIWEVVQAASTKPFGFMPFYPGPGWGGHCIPVDPFYLTWKAQQHGVHSKFIELAGLVNQHMPDYVVNRVSETLALEKKSLQNAKILILGLAYKPDVDDDRESPAYVLIERLESLGAIVSYNDPYIPQIKKTRAHSALEGRQSQPISPDYDLVLLVTAHQTYRSYDFSQLPIPLVDTRNCILNKPLKYFRA